jgi:hypothetical protein
MTQQKPQLRLPDGVTTRAQKRHQAWQLSGETLWRPDCLRQASGLLSSILADMASNVDAALRLQDRTDGRHLPAELITDRHARSVDVRAFRPERFVEGKFIAGPHLYKPRPDHVEPAR